MPCLSKFRCFLTDDSKLSGGVIRINHVPLVPYQNHTPYQVHADGSGFNPVI